MEQQADAFTQRRFELMVEMATKKLAGEINALKEHIASLSNEIGTMKNQINRIQFSQPAPYHLPVAQHECHEQPNIENYQEPGKKEVKIVDCRPDGERTESFQSGTARNSEPAKPRFGDYKSEDVAIDKFFYFGRR